MNMLAGTGALEPWKYHLEFNVADGSKGNKLFKSRLVLRQIFCPSPENEGYLLSCGQCSEVPVIYYIHMALDTY